MYNQIFTGSLSPTAAIAVNRNRLKSYGEKVYLKDKTLFEIELFNPKTTKVLAKIYLDGIAISSAGVVINPGQRVFLERWLDEPRKFIFQTYEVDGSQEAKSAISENGKVRVEFYDQVVTPQLSVNPITWTYSSLNDPIYGGTTQNNMTYFSNTDVIGQNSAIRSASLKSSTSDVTLDSLETGRSEKGEDSSQQFTTDSSTYNSWTCNTVHMQILPESQKPIEVSEIRNYCTNCGTRHKKSSWKFCPTCGTQI